MTKLTRQERIVLAAIFGGSNLGLDRPKRERVQAGLADTSTNITLDVADIAYRFWSGYMESDGMEKAILQECRHWHRVGLKGEDRESVTKTWPYIAELVW
jgi:hypothetical protein